MPQLSTFNLPLSTPPGARLYHSTASVWLSVDPLSDKYPSVSPYAYCANNPVRLVDPNGEFPIETIWDIVNVVYDVGAAVVNHIKGDHTRAKEHWVDAAVDVAAVFIPYVPAGATKAIGLTVKGFKTIDKVSAGGKTYSNMADFYKSVKNLSTGERVAKFKEVGGQVAKQNGWKKNATLSKKNGHDIYTDRKSGTHYSLDTQHGEFEILDKKGETPRCYYFRWETCRKF